VHTTTLTGAFSRQSLFYYEPVAKPKVLQLALILFSVSNAINRESCLSISLVPYGRSLHSSHDSLNEVPLGNGITIEVSKVSNLRPNEQYGAICKHSPLKLSLAWRQTMQPTQLQEPFQRAVDLIGDLARETGIAPWKLYSLLGSLWTLD
jgi:hypothetical protein